MTRIETQIFGLWLGGQMAAAKFRHLMILNRWEQHMPYHAVPNEEINAQCFMIVDWDRGHREDQPR